MTKGVQPCSRSPRTRIRVLPSTGMLVAGIRLALALCPFSPNEPLRRQRRRMRRSQRTRRRAFRPASSGHSTWMPRQARFGFGNSSIPTRSLNSPSGDLSDNWFEGVDQARARCGIHDRELLHRSTASSVRSARAPSAPRRHWWAMMHPRSTSKMPTSAGAPANSLGDLGENVLDFTVGRTQYKLGHGMLLYDGACGRRFTGRLLDRCAQGLRVCRDRPVQARQSTRSRRSISTRTTCRRRTPTASSGA